MKNVFLALTSLLGTFLLLVSIEATFWIANQTSLGSSFRIAHEQVQQQEAEDSTFHEYEVPSSYKDLEPRIPPSWPVFDHSVLDTTERDPSGFSVLRNGTAVPSASSTFHSKLKLKKDGSLLWNIKYTIDEFGRRRVPLEEGKRREKYLLLLGDSYAFGYGLDDWQTLPAHISRMTEEYVAYNYAYPGYAPNDLLQRLRHEDLRNQIAERQGIVVYEFIDTHVPRIVCPFSLAIRDPWNLDRPYFEEQGGEFTYLGSFRSGRPFLSFLFRILEHEQVIKFFGRDFPAIDESDYQLFSRLVAAVRDNVNEQLGTTPFYVLFYPLSSNYASKLKPFLDEMKVNYLDYNDFDISKQTDRPRIIYDGHPSNEANEVIASQLIRDLKLK